jgi:hypothetical protein
MQPTKNDVYLTNGHRVIDLRTSDQCENEWDTLTTNSVEGLTHDPDFEVWIWLGPEWLKTIMRLQDVEDSFVKQVILYVSKRRILARHCKRINIRQMLLKETYKSTLR